MIDETRMLCAIFWVAAKTETIFEMAEVLKGCESLKILRMCIY